MPRVKKGTSDPGTEFWEGQSPKNQYPTNTKLTPAASLGAETRGQGQSTGTQCTDQPWESGMTWSGLPSQAHLVGKLPEPLRTHTETGLQACARAHTHTRAHEITHTLTPEPLPASDLETGPGP